LKFGTIPAELRKTATVKVRKTNKRENKIRKEKKKPVIVHRKSLPEKWLNS